MKPFLTCSFQAPFLETQLYFCQSSYIQTRLENSRCIVIADTNTQWFAKRFLDSTTLDKLIVIPSGEFYKTQETKQQIEEALFKKKCGKDTLIVALGGGVLCDIAGFVASTYLRGVDLCFIPTTLLCMVDACLGGKTGINTSFGKNLIGTLYPAQEVWIDLSIISTWSPAHLVEGMAEIIKSALIADAELFSFLVKQHQRFFEKDLEFFQRCIHTTLDIKARLVTQDFKDQNVRRSLNFGHTIAHALEKCSQYTLSHGKAVALGLCVETWISGQLFPHAREVLPKLLELFELLKIPLFLPKECSFETLTEAMDYEKKNLSKAVCMALIEDLGRVAPFDGNYCSPLSSNLLKDGLEWMFNTFSRQ